ncbi:MAG: hypothetical protein WCT49_04170 [Candidatus Paceibacterota bacterium]|jgi:hypothetical protein|nr:hypothetical protein [Candidatus Paceibacterota bacterium]
MEQQPEKIKKVERLNEMPEEWQNLRARILEYFENKTDGLDIERVNEFVTSEGLSSTDILFIDFEDIRRLSEILRPYGLADQFSRSTSGVRIPELNLAIVARNPDKEQLNGQIYTEGVAVHESAHGSHKGSFVEYGCETYVPRLGFALQRSLDDRSVPYSGIFLEEGFAEIMKGEYLEKYMSGKEKDRLLEVLGLPEKTPLSREVTVSFQSKSGEVVETVMPIKYLYIKSENGVDCSASAPAASALEIAWKKYPELRTAMIESRGDESKLKEIPKIFERISPGLYSKLQKIFKADSYHFSLGSNIIAAKIKE